MKAVSIIKDVLYGLISGFSEFLPVSSLGHQSLLMQLFGWRTREPIRDLVIHIAMIAALLVCNNSFFSSLARERRIAARGRRLKNQLPRETYDLRIIRSATVPLILGLLTYLSSMRLERALLWVSLFFCINGVILFIPDYVRGSNKDAKSMSGLDGILLGMLGILSVFPGISRTGVMCAYASIRGGAQSHALNWVLAISLPALIVFCVFDVLLLLTYGATITFIAVLGYLLSAGAAFCGSYLSIVLMRFLTVRAGYSGFAYYSWGASLFTLILYLIT